jgi:AbrB family looped-hinge helix DNA binding protein
MTSKGQVTIPAQVRRALDLHEGDTVFFRVVDGQAVVSREPNLADLAGTVPVPDEVQGLGWEEIRARAWRGAAERST